MGVAKGKGFAGFPEGMDSFSKELRSFFVIRISQASRMPFAMVAHDFRRDLEGISHSVASVSQACRRFVNGVSRMSRKGVEGVSKVCFKMCQKCVAWVLQGSRQCVVGVSNECRSGVVRLSKCLKKVDDSIVAKSRRSVGCRRSVERVAKVCRRCSKGKSKGCRPWKLPRSCFERMTQVVCRKSVERFSKVSPKSNVLLWRRKEVGSVSK